MATFGFVNSSKPERFFSPGPVASLMAVFLSLLKLEKTCLRKFLCRIQPFYFARVRLYLHPFPSHIINYWWPWVTLPSKKTLLNKIDEQK